MEIITALLASPKILAVLGVTGTVLLGIAFIFYRLFIKFLGKYEDVQEIRIKEAQENTKDYFELSNELQKTMDILIRTVSRKNGGNGGSKNA